MNKQTSKVLVAGTRTSYLRTGERQIVFERIYDAPREAVFKAFCDPKRIHDWWSPPGHTTKVETMDVRAGGRWTFIQTDPNGEVHTFSGEYRAVVPPSKIVSTLAYGGAPGMTIVETYEFVAQGTKTLLRVTSVYPSGAALGGMVHVGMDSSGGWVEGSRHQWRLERLASLVERSSP